MSQQSDDELMVQIAKGDQRAFGRLFERHSGKALGYACRLIGDRERAEDVAQEVWLKVVKAAERYEGTGNFIAWLYTLTRHTCLNMIRDQRRLFEALASEGEPESFEIPDRRELEETIMKMAEVERVKREIDQLPDSQRLALVAWLTEDLSYDELAAHMSISVPSLKSLLFRARRNLILSLGVSG